MTAHVSRVSSGDFPGGPVVKTSPFNAGSVGWIPGQPTCLFAKKPKHYAEVSSNKFNKDCKNGPHREKKRKESLIKNKKQLFWSWMVAMVGKIP